jgi:hypothetical protein
MGEYALPTHILDKPTSWIDRLKGDRCMNALAAQLKAYNNQLPIPRRSGDR